MDTGVDYNNPSLAGQMYHFTAHQQKALGCDEYGYCAAGYKGNDVWISVAWDPLCRHHRGAGFIYLEGNGLT